MLYFLHMNLDNIQSHKRKYISFFIIAVLVASATYLVFKSEARSYPFRPDEADMIAGGMNPLCFRFPRLSLYFHLCTEPSPIISSDSSEISTEVQATSTPEDSASSEGPVTASSTEETQQDSTSTPENTSGDQISATVEATSSGSLGQ